MPTFRITSPDGKVYQVTGPDGATQEQALAQVQAQIKQPDALDNPDPTGSFGENVAAGAGKAIVDMGRGARQILSNVPLLNRADVFNPKKVQAEVDESRKLDAPLMKTGGGKTGLVLGTAIPAAMIPGSGYLNAAGVGAALGALTPTSGDESRLLNTVVGGATGAAAKFATDKIGQAVASRLQGAEAAGAQQAAQDAPRLKVLEESRKAGYVVPPNSANPSATNAVLEGVSGKIKTAQAAAEKNQTVTNDLAKRALGLPSSAALDDATLSAARMEAGKAYQAVKDLPSKFKSDQQFQKDIVTLGNDFSAAAAEFPEIAGNPAIETLKRSLAKDEISPTAAVELIKKLRFDASKNLKSFDDPAKAALGSAQKDAANAMEDLIERNLLSLDTANFAINKSGTNLPINNLALLDKFRAARERIAKVYSVDAALKGGNVDASKLASQMSKGKPLSDELKTIADFAEHFPKAAQLLKEPAGAISPLDVGLAFATGNPALMAARPVVRSAILSKPYQSAMTTPSNAPSALLRLSAGAAANPLLRSLVPPTIAQNSLLYLNEQ